MFSGRVSWNLESLDRLAAHLGRQRRGKPAKIVVWAHDSHLGDARATEASMRTARWDAGQLPETYPHAG